MVTSESYAIVLRTDPERFRITVFDQYKGKVRAAFFGELSPGMVIRVHIVTKTHLPQIQLKEIVGSPCVIARANIWWLHTLFGLLDACVPLGSGVGPLYEQVLWLCMRDVLVDNQLQMRYCAKIVTTLGLHRTLHQLCKSCVYALHTTSVDNLESLNLDSECSLRLADWVKCSIEEHVGSSFVEYMQNSNR